MLFLSHFRLAKKLGYLILAWKGASSLSFSLFPVKPLRIRYKSSQQIILFPPELTNLVKNMFTGRDWSFQKMCRWSKGKFIPVQALEALRVVRRRGSHTFCRQSAHRWRRGKGKFIPVQALEALGVARGWGSHIFRHSDNRWRQGCQPYAPAAVYPQEDSWYSFLLEAESTPGAIVRLEWSGKFKKKITSSGTRTRDLLACSIVPQPTTLPRALRKCADLPEIFESPRHRRKCWSMMWTGGFIKNCSVTSRLWLCSVVNSCYGIGAAFCLHFQGTSGYYCFEGIYWRPS
jgi:hypothetical protein